MQFCSCFPAVENSKPKKPVSDNVNISKTLTRMSRPSFENAHVPNAISRLLHIASIFPDSGCMAAAWSENVSESS